MPTGLGQLVEGSPEVTGTKLYSDVVCKQARGIILLLQGIELSTGYTLYNDMLE